MTWDILVCSILHRHDMLCELLDHLGRQLMPGVGVLIARDNQETVYGEKCRRLLAASQADYVSYVDDDDWVPDDYVAEIVKALSARPDYVGFRVRYTQNGEPRTPVTHTLDCGGWVDQPTELLRDISHLNPTRRELALQATWQGGGGADRRWADEMRTKGLLKRQVFIDRELYHYRHRPGASFDLIVGGTPFQGDPPPCPPHDFVTWVS